MPSIHDEVRIVPYREEWAQRYHLTKQLIIGVLQTEDIPCDVRHVGSTAVHGMSSKPIVDILVLVAPKDLMHAVSLLSDIFTCLGECGRPGRFFFSDGDDENDAVYVHLTTADHQVSIDQLAFLSLLESSETLRQEYKDLKCHLAEKYPMDRLGYRMEKSAFIARCLHGRKEG